MEHTTLFYNYLFTTHTYIIFFILFFSISNLHMSDLFVHCLFVYLYIVLLLSVSCHSFFLLSTIFIFFSHTTQHNIQNKTKQNSRHILNISRFNQKGWGEGRTKRTQKLLLYIITYIQQKTLPSIHGRGPGTTNSRRCTFT